LYPPLTALNANNYPPLSFYVVGGLGRFTGDHVIAGRAVTLASLLVLAVTIGLIARRVSGSAMGALFAGLLFVGYVAVWHEQYFGTSDPQWLGHALATAGLLILLGGSGERWRLVAAAALMVAGGFAKHILVPLPLAVTLWLFFHDRRSFFTWLVAAAALAVGALTAATLAHGPNFLAGVLMTPRTYSLVGLALGFYWMAPLAPMMGAALVLAMLDQRDARVRLLVLYAALAGLWGVFISSAVGVWYNAVFDLIIALAIAAGCLVGRLGGHPIAAVPLGRSAVQTAAALILALTVLLPAPRALGRAWLSLADLGASRAQAAEDIAFIATRDGGPAMCEMLSLCYWAGKPFEVDFFSTGQKLATGLIDQAALIDLITRRHFAVIHIEGPETAVTAAAAAAPGSRRLPPVINDAISAHYMVERVSPQSGYFLVPKPAASG
jgi:hypothetical protein